MRNRRIFPGWDQIKSLRTPLTEGELTLVTYLEKHLPSQWEIYVQPYFNGDRPDVVIVNPQIGVMIFEVKDWRKNNYCSEPALYFDKNQNRNISYRQFFVHDKRSRWKIASPVKQVERYRTNLISRYVPEIGENIDRNFKYLAPFKIGLYFHYLNSGEAQELVKINPRQCTVFGRDHLVSGQNLDRIVPDVKLRYSISMKTDWYHKIVFWLKPPFHAVEQGTKIVLNDEQKRHVASVPGLHQRLRGVAGSGKTLVLAQRAANLASQGKRVLIVSYNLTLWHYIRDHVSRVQRSFSWSNIEFTHFHGFCRDFLQENGVPWPQMEKNYPATFFNLTIPSLVIKLKRNGLNRNKREYDAILIDEGQDFQKEWYEMLCLFLSDNDELLITIDEKQNIYHKENQWISSPSNTKFRGRWRILNTSYRIPAEILEISNRFAKNFLSDIGEEPIPNLFQTELFLPHFMWKNLKEDLNPMLLNVINWMTLKKSIHPSDIVILVPTHHEGLKLVRLFEEFNYNVNHVFDNGSSLYSRNKKSFWMGDSRLKISTIHSFKGWELLNVILLIPDSGNTRDTDYLIYTSLTRTRQNLIVFNRNKRYDEFGAKLKRINWN